jgi:hypothetical protein
MTSSGTAVPVRKPPLTTFQFISLMTHRACSPYFRRVSDTTLHRAAQKWLDTACSGPGVVTGIRAGQPRNCGRIPGSGNRPSSSQNVLTVSGPNPSSHSVGDRGSTLENKLATCPHIMPGLSTSGFLLPHTPS